jgi:hypothetical protein
LLVDADDPQVSASTGGDKQSLQQRRFSWNAFFAGIFLAAIGALLALGALYICSTGVVPLMKAPLEPILCGAGQQIQTGYVYGGAHSRGATGISVSCVASDGTTNDVTHAAYITVYGTLYPILFVAASCFMLYITRSDVFPRNAMTEQPKPRRVKYPGLIALGVLVPLLMFGAAHCSQ